MIMDMDKYAIGRFAILTLLGMFTAYTLVSLFGLIIGTALSMLVLYAYIKVMNRMVDDDTNYGSITYYYYHHHHNSRKIKVRYKCLSCNNIHNKRECPRCGSKVKQVEF
jgi:uncharacterized paraquat-inducible protein A